MGKVVLVWRLATRDLRRHVAQAVLLVVAIAAAAAAFAMALALNGVTSRSPYAATRAATKGPDVVAYLTSASQATPLVHAAGVASHSGPFPVASGVIRFDGRQADVLAEGRTTAPAGVDQPLVTSGSWVRPGGIVIERTFAHALGVSVGDRLSVNGEHFSVAGIAVTAAQAPYPNLCNGTLIANTAAASKFSDACPVPSFKIPMLSLDGGRTMVASADDVGLIWTTEANAIALTSKANPLTTYALNLKLANPNDAQAFAFDRASAASVPLFSTWEGLEAEDAVLVQDGHGVLEPGAVMLALLAIASVAVLVGRRLSEYGHRVGLVKAVGGTPSVVAATFLEGNLMLALLAAGLGLLAGWLASPLITKPGAALIGSAGAPSFSASTVVDVVTLAIVVSLAATLVPALRAARSSTVAALNDAARPPKRRGRLIGISNRLPVSTQFGLRLVARRPRRALLSAANVAVTVGGIVTVLAFHAYADGKLTSGSVVLAATGLSDPVVNRDEQLLTVITVMLVILAVLNALFTTWAIVLDARRSSALMRALGARARQVTSGLVVAQVLSALPGAVVGIPAGLLLFLAAVHGGTLPPPFWLVATVVGTLVTMAALTVVPVWLGTHQPVAEVLQTEAT